MNNSVVEFKRRTVACWKLEDERSRVGSYKKNNSVLEVTRRTAACWQLQAKRQRSIKHVLQGSRRTRTQTTGRYYTPPHPTPPRPTPPHPTRASGPKTSLAGDPQKSWFYEHGFRSAGINQMWWHNGDSLTSKLSLNHHAQGCFKP